MTGFIAKRLVQSGKRAFLAVCGFLAFLSLPAQTTAKTDVRAYFFGNSLVQHESGNPQTSVPYWLGKLAQAAGYGFRASGQFGLLRDFARDLPPLANWSITGVTPAWRSRQDFSASGINAVILTPANFIQGQAATRPYDGDNPEQVSPLDASLAPIDWTTDRLTGKTVFVYEGWADMGGFSRRFPPKPRHLARYHAFNKAGYHQWYTEFVKSLQAARPGLDIRLLPVAKQLSELFTQTALADLPVEALYTDSAPHGTADLYFLASMISYKGLFGEAPPEDFQPPKELHPLVRENYRSIRNFLNGQEFQAKTPPPQANAAPSLAMGLDGIADWSVQQPFINVMKSGRAWVGHIRGQWGGWTAQDLRVGGYLDANGWPRRIPDELTHIESYILTDQPAAAVSTGGRYRLTYDGNGRLEVSGLARNIRRSPGKIWFDYTPGEGLVGIGIYKTDPDGTGNYIRNIAVVKEENIKLFEVGEIFNPLWLEKVGGLRSVRFMDWMFTNGSTVVRWADRPKVKDYSFAEKGVALPVMVELANRIGADPWFTMPHLADDDYNRRFAQYVKRHLDKRLRAYVEYSNELWNFTFPQAQWALQQAEQRWGAAAEGDGWLQFAGMRAAQVLDIWRGVYGKAAQKRLIRVVATHTDWPGLEEAFLQAPLLLAEGGAAPVGSFDAYAVSGYFGFDLGTDEQAPDVLRWINKGQQKAEQDAAAQGLSGPARADYIAAHKYDLATRKSARQIRGNSLPHLVSDSWPYQAGVARDNDLMLVMYEGGTHVVGLDSFANNQTLADFFNYFNYTPEIAGIYGDLLREWKKAGGTLFNAFVDVAKASQWGSWGALRHLDDSNPRWDVLMDFNTNTAAWWSDRPASVFAGGVILQGTAAGETLTGTPQNDTLIGRKGNDVLVSNGGDDRLHGGKGFDLAHLAGSRTDYQVVRQGELIRLSSASNTITLRSVEAVTFADRPDQQVPVADL